MKYIRKYPERFTTICSNCKKEYIYIQEGHSMDYFIDWDVKICRCFKFDIPETLLSNPHIKSILIWAKSIRLVQVK